MEVFSDIKHLFDISFQQGVFPEKLKIACVTPIFKNGDNSLFTNYRPISVYAMLFEVIRTYYLQ